MITVVSVNITDVTPSVATVLNSLQIALYSIPGGISLVCTYLISHCILCSSFQNRCSRIGGQQKLRKIIDIIVQSSLVYTITLVCAAATDVTTPHAERSLSEETIFHFISALLTPISVLYAYSAIVTEFLNISL